MTESFPTFNQYFRRCGGSRGIVDSNLVQNYIESVIKGLQGDITNGVITQGNIAEVRRLINIHSLRREEDMKRLENNLKESSFYS
jgi:hypothetical protein